MRQRRKWRRLGCVDIRCGRRSYSPMKNHAKQQKLLHRISQKRIDPAPLTGDTPVTRLVDEAMLSYNAGRLREACRLFSTKVLEPDVTVGLSLSGALSPAGLCMSA